MPFYWCDIKRLSFRILVGDGVLPALGSRETPPAPRSHCVAGGPSTPPPALLPRPRRLDAGPGATARRHRPRPRSALRPCSTPSRSSATVPAALPGKVTFCRNYERRSGGCSTTRSRPSCASRGDSIVFETMILAYSGVPGTPSGHRNCNVFLAASDTLTALSTSMLRTGHVSSVHQQDRAPPYWTNLTCPHVRPVSHQVSRGPVKYFTSPSSQDPVFAVIEDPVAPFPHTWLACRPGRIQLGRRTYCANLDIRDLTRRRTLSFGLVRGPSSDGDRFRHGNG